MSKELKVSFYLKRESRLEKCSSKENVAYPIIGKIIIGNSVAQFSTKLKIEERLWHVKSGRATGKSCIATQFNREINSINLRIHSHYRDILERSGAVTALEVKNAFQGIASEQKTLLVLFEDMMREFHSRIGIDRSASTYHSYRKTYKHLERFIREKYKVRDIPLIRLDLPFIEQFDFHLRVERGLKPGSILICTIYLQKVARLALHRNLISRPPFMGYKPEKPELQKRSLTKDEFDRIISIPIESASQCFVRDLFVFACMTGISHADLKNLTWKNIITEEDGSLWISMSRQKTGVPFHVKLLDIPSRIMEKYKGLAKDGHVFPVLGQSRINFVLKIIGQQCGITTPLTFHRARHCFASQVCLSQGVPIETVSRMLGHRDIQTTQRYASVNNEKIGNDMKLLSQKLSGKFNYIESK